MNPFRYNARPIPPKNILDQHFCYSAGSGRITYSPDHRHPGESALYYREKRDIRRTYVRIPGYAGTFDALRVIWRLLYNEDPGDDIILPRDGDYTNLSASNLHKVSRWEEYVARRKIRSQRKKPFYTIVSLG